MTNLTHSRARTTGVRRLLAPVAGALLLAAAAPSAAQAAESLSLGLVAGTMEEAPTTLIVDATADTPGEVVVFTRPASDIACGTTAVQEAATSGLELARLAVAAGTSTPHASVTMPDGGPQLLCGYLQDAGADADPARVLRAAGADVAERPATIGVAFAAPPVYGQPVALDVSATATPGRFITTKLFLDGRDSCALGAASPWTVSGATDVGMSTGIGSQFSFSRSFPLQSFAPGVKLRFCSYVVEHHLDQHPEAVATFAVTTPQAPAPVRTPVGVVPAPTAPTDRQAPTLTRLSVARQSIRLTVSEAARVQLRAERRLTGVRTKSGRCAAAKAGARRSAGRSCTRYVTARTTTVDAPAGATTIAFDGTLGGKRLPAGRYRLTARPTDAAGNVGRTRTATFRVSSGR